MHCSRFVCRQVIDVPVTSHLAQARGDRKKGAASSHGAFELLTGSGASGHRSRSFGWSNQCCGWLDPLGGLSQGDHHVPCNEQLLPGSLGYLRGGWF